LISKEINRVMGKKTGVLIGSFELNQKTFEIWNYQDRDDLILNENEVEIGEFSSLESIFRYLTNYTRRLRLLSS